MSRGVSISVDRVSKTFTTSRGETVEALTDVSLEVPAGQFVSVVGPSGCGKSTLMTLIAGLETASAGTILVGGTPSRAGIPDAAIVFQKDLLLDWRSVIDNVLLPIEIKGLDLARHRDEALALLASVGLDTAADLYPSELSGGMRQRVAICRALIQRPGLLLMDEPFGALDALTREQMNLDLQRTWMAEKCTVIFITHSIEEAVLLSDRVLVMSKGPGRITQTHTIETPRPRGMASRQDPHYSRAVEAIRRNFMALGILSES